MKGTSRLLLVSCLALAPPVLSADAATEKAQEVFLTTATRVYAEAIAEMRESERTQVLDYLKVADRQAAAGKLAGLLMENWKHAFEVSNTEAAEMLEGAYNDHENAAKARAAIKDVKRMGSRLPFLTEFLIKRVSSGKYHAGRKLDFAARLLDAQARKVRRELGE